MPLYSNVYLTNECNVKCPVSYLVIKRTHPAATNKKKQSLRNGLLATFGLFTITAMAPDQYIKCENILSINNYKIPETAIGSNTAAPNNAPSPNLVVSPP